MSNPNLFVNIGNESQSISKKVNQFLICICKTRIIIPNFRSFFGKAPHDNFTHLDTPS